MLLIYCFILCLYIAVILASVIIKPLPNIQETTTDGFSIIGGEAADIKEVPYQVALLLNNMYFVCGGSIIAPNIILTAAHCCYGATDTPEMLQVRAGSTCRNKDGSLLNVTKILPHPKYNRTTLDNDVALMWLSEKLEYGETIKAVDLAKSGEELKPGTDVLVSGWGKQKLVRQNPERVLQKLTIPTIDTNQCKKLYDEYNGPVKVLKVTDNMMCAGLEGKNACYGDSGGPLVHSAVQYGIVSWGVFCLDRKYPVVYTKVAAVRDWIDNAIKEDNRKTN